MQEKKVVLGELLWGELDSRKEDAEEKRKGRCEKLGKLRKEKKRPPPSSVRFE